MRAGLAQRLRPHAWPAAAGLVLGLLALGPALGRGFVLSYDMVFVPDPPISVADLGFSGGPARAVPSDLVVALMTRVLPAQFVQKLILIGIFVLACTGAAALLQRGWQRLGDGAPGPAPAGLVAGVCYAWNPFVAERLIMGQWAMLLGYAGLPWVLRELCWRDPGGQVGRVRAGRLALAVLPAAVGGFAAMSITIVAALATALATAFCGADDAWRSRARRGLITLGVLGIASLPWIIPSLVVPVHADPAGATVFAARADTPFGTIGSLLMLSGIWNSEAVPAGYGGAASVSWLLVVAAAILGYVVVARPRRLTPGLGVAGVAGFALAVLGAWSPTLALLRDAISAWPGFALLRDGQQFIAPLALTESIGLGSAVAALTSPAARTAAPPDARTAAPPDARTAAPPEAPLERASRASNGAGVAALIGVLALLAPVVLLPGLAWGAAGRLRPVEYPADWLAARSAIEASRQPGSVLLLPWAQYRRYPWNHGEAVFDPWPRLLARSMIWNDALTVGRTTVAAESPQARRLGPAITSDRPLTSLLRAAGVRYVIIDAGRMLGRTAGQPLARLAFARLAFARLPGARVLLASSDLIVFKLSR